MMISPLRTTYISIHKRNEDFPIAFFVDADSHQYETFLNLAAKL